MGVGEAGMFRTWSITYFVSETYGNCPNIFFTLMASTSPGDGPPFFLSVVKPAPGLKLGRGGKNVTVKSRPTEIASLLLSKRLLKVIQPV